MLFYQFVVFVDSGTNFAKVTSRDFSGANAVRLIGNGFAAVAAFQGNISPRAAQGNNRPLTDSPQSGRSPPHLFGMNASIGMSVNAKFSP